MAAALSHVPRKKAIDLVEGLSVIVNEDKYFWV